MTHMRKLSAILLVWLMMCSTAWASQWERTHTFRDDNFHAIVTVSSDGTTSRMDMFVKFFIEDPSRWVCYQLTGLPSVCTTGYDITLDPNYNANSKIWSYSIESSTLTVGPPPNNWSSFVYLFEIGHDPDELNTSETRMYGAFILR